MNAFRFDELVRSLSGGRARRDVTRPMAEAKFSGGAPADGDVVDAATGRANSREASRGATGGGAIVSTADCAGKRCGGDGCGGICGECGIGFACDDGVCRCGGAECAAGDSCCAVTCANLATDAGHCGACGSVCRTGERCLGEASVGSGRPIRGALTLDDVYFRNVDVDPFLYVMPDAGEGFPPTDTVVSCTTDSDCADCPATVRAGGSIRRVRGCGCHRLSFDAFGYVIADSTAGTCAVYCEV